MSDVNCDLDETKHQALEIFKEGLQDLDRWRREDWTYYGVQINWVDRIKPGFTLIFYDQNNRKTITLRIGDYAGPIILTISDWGKKSKFKSHWAYKAYQALEDHHKCKQILAALNPPPKPQPWWKFW